MAYRIFSSGSRQEFMGSGTVMETMRIVMNIKKESSKINQVLGNGRPREGRVRMTGACLRVAGRRMAKQRGGARRK